MEGAPVLTAHARITFTSLHTRGSLRRSAVTATCPPPGNNREKTPHMPHGFRRWTWGQTGDMQPRTSTCSLEKAGRGRAGFKALINLSVFTVKTPLVSRQRETMRTNVKPAPKNTQGRQQWFYSHGDARQSLFLYVIYLFIINLLLPSPVLSLQK